MITCHHCKLEHVEAFVGKMSEMSMYRVMTPVKKCYYCNPMCYMAKLGGEMPWDSDVIQWYMAQAPELLRSHQTLHAAATSSLEAVSTLKE